MLVRIITSLVALCVLIPVLFLSNTWVLPIAVAIACAIATGEALNCIGSLKKPIVSILFILSAAFAPFAVRLTASLGEYCLIMIGLVLAIVLYLMAVLVFSKGRLEISEIAVSAFMAFYVSVGFSSIVMLHDFFESGKYTYLLVFVGAWVTDIFAYFCGRFFGKHKLIPEVSPKKTVEGSIGGTLFAGVSFVLFGYIANSLGYIIDTGYVQLFVFGLIAALVAQVGDLCMSALKRYYGIKDFGKIFPGHGGMLDRFDSIIAVATVLLILNTIVSNF